MQLRQERPGDAEAICRITREAFADEPFSEQTEHRIVAALRDAGALTLSLVAEVNGEVCGHAAASPVTISDGSVGWFGIGPVSVQPASQGQGIGSALMRRLVADLARMGAHGAVLLGDPAWYSRFGFVAADTLCYPGPPAEYFQALAFGDNPASGVVSYHRAFEQR